MRTSLAPTSPCFGESHGVENPAYQHQLCGSQVQVRLVERWQVGGGGRHPDWAASGSTGDSVLCYSTSAWYGIHNAAEDTPVTSHIPLREVHLCASHWACVDLLTVFSTHIHPTSRVKFTTQNVAWNIAQIPYLWGFQGNSARRLTRGHFFPHGGEKVLLTFYSH